MPKTLPLKNYEFLYSIDENGNIYNKKNKKRKPNKQKGRLHMHLSKNGVVVRKQISRLVYETFSGPIARGMYINHIDGDPLNNHISNLESVTPKENTRHAWKMGLCKKKYGNKTNSCKLSFSDIKNIRKLYLKKYTLREIAIKYNCHYTNISYIVRNKSRLYA